MRTLEESRSTLEDLLPGLDKQLEAIDLLDLEKPGNPGLGLFRDTDGPGLLVPAQHGGLGASAMQAMHCARAIGARSPSLAIATTMHHFSVASLVALANNSTGFEWMLLDAVATDRLLVSSAFAEGRTGQGILSPTVEARWDDGGWLLSGSKKPCSLSRSMNLMTASVALKDDEGGTELGVALVPADSPGISVRPFWSSNILGGAESDEVVLEDVRIEDELMIRPRLDPGSNLDNLQTVGLVWFTLLTSASYLGMASALAARVLDEKRASSQARGEVLIELESAFLALGNVASSLDTNAADNDSLARALIARYSAQRVVRTVSQDCVGILGGMSFISGPEVAYLLSASAAFQFHPPSMHAASAALDEWSAGNVLRVD